MKKLNNQDYGLRDPDFMDQENFDYTVNFSPDEDPYQYQEEFIDDGRNQTTDFSGNESIRMENIPNEERVINEDNSITNDSEKANQEKDNSTNELIFENDLEKERDLDEDEDLSDFDAEHYPENHPRA
ncbi:MULTISPECIES: hypothetical protein [Flavobacterium]|uniref:hypothetical protein n=1 Tax=Flavobacterium TaxID=237 RepID=UPI00100A79E3|nr:hypothetical protein [Flavobacterium sp. YO64]RXM45091.1 hypothetical protein BOW57_07310 [Flavobacterium sp. YO64]